MGHKTPLYRIHKGKRAISSWPVELDSYKLNLLRDYKIRAYLNKMCKDGNLEIADIVISGNNEGLGVDIHSGKPGAVLGKNGSNVELIKKEIAKISSLQESKVDVNVVPIPDPSRNAAIIAMRIARDMQNRKNCNMVIRTHMQDAIRSGVTGIKILCSGRLNGSEIASVLSNYHGKVPKHTIRANISYATYEADTASGKCGVKVWINIDPHAARTSFVPRNRSEDQDGKNSKNTSSFRHRKDVQSVKGAKL